MISSTISRTRSYRTPRRNECTARTLRCFSRRVTGRHSLPCHASACYRQLRPIARTSRQPTPTRHALCRNARPSSRGVEATASRHLSVTISKGDHPLGQAALYSRSLLLSHSLLHRRLATRNDDLPLTRPTPEAPRPPRGAHQIMTVSRPFSVTDPSRRPSPTVGVDAATW